MRMDYAGVLTRDDSEHFTFIETLPEATAKRNPHVFEGEFITVTLRKDGSLCPNFRPKRIGERNFNIERYVWGVAFELREAFSCLGEE